MMLQFNNEHCITSFGEDILSEISRCLKPEDAYFFSICNRKLKNIGTRDARFLSTDKAIRSGNIEYLKLVEEIKGKETNRNRHLSKIINSRNLEMIKYLIPDVFTIQCGPKDYTRFILRGSIQAISYLLNPDFSEIDKQHIISLNRIDVINYYLNKGIVIFDNFDGFDTTTVVNKDFLKYLHKNGVSIVTNISKLCTTEITLEFTKWIFDNLDLISINKILSNEPYYGNISNDVATYLFVKGYEIYIDLNKLEINDKIIENLSNEDKELYYKQLEKYSDSIDFSHKNIFNLNLISKIDKNDNYYSAKILFYAIKYNRSDIYGLEKFNFIENIDNIRIICELNNIKILRYYIYPNPIQSYFLKIHINAITKQKNENALSLLIKAHKYHTLDIIKCHKADMINVANQMIFEKFHSRRKLEKEDAVYVCMCNDPLFLKNLFEMDLVDKKYIVKHCSVKNIADLLANSNIDLNFLNTNNNLVRYGNLDVIKYYCEYLELDTNSLIEAFFNCPQASRLASKSSYYKTTTLSQHILSVEYERKAYRICISGYECIRQYYIFLTELNQKISDYDMEKIIDNDNEILYDYASKWFPITKRQIYRMIYKNSTRLLIAARQRNQLAIPFCYNTIRNMCNVENVETVLLDILSNDCICSDILACADEHELYEITNFIENYLCIKNSDRYLYCDEKICCGIKRLKTAEYTVRLSGSIYKIECKPENVAPKHVAPKHVLQNYIRPNYIPDCVVIEPTKHTSNTYNHYIFSILFFLFTSFVLNNFI